MCECGGGCEVDAFHGTGGDPKIGDKKRSFQPGRAFLPLPSEEKTGAEDESSFPALCRSH